MTSAASRGVLLWIDDEFEGLPMPSEDPWGVVLSGESDRVFRLMDLTLEVAASVDEAVAALAELDRLRRHGTYVYCIVDLRIPARAHEPPQMKHGLALAADLRARGYPFSFLSAKSDAARSLDRADLAAIPYYVKQPSTSPWQTLPEALKHVVLNEFKSRINWLDLASLTDRLAAGSNSSLCIDASPEDRPLTDLASRFFPFFGIYRDFAERWEYRGQLEPGRTLAVRSNRLHSDPFVQQSLLVMLTSMLKRAAGQVQFQYGVASDEAFFRGLQGGTGRDPRKTIRVLRVDPGGTSPALLETRLAVLMQLPGTLILIVPSDESCDAFSDVLLDRGIPTLGEIPQDRLDGGGDRRLVVRRSAELVVRAWLAQEGDKSTAEADEVALSRPELLINPIDWQVLMGASHSVEALSDPYECIDELARALDTLASGDRDEMLSLLSTGQPLPYSLLLQVGRATFLESEEGREWGVWVARAIDRWLESSWRFPHGLDRHQRYSKRVQEAGSGTPWQDACYEVLVGMLAEHTTARGGGFESADAVGRDLGRVDRFVRALGEGKFLSGGGRAVDWEALEFLRWPHLRYPMPLAITNRLKEAGRFLWIQPDGLDLASALPVGRQRYRLLVDSVEQYWTVLGWGSDIVEKLPRGWSCSVRYLLEVLRSKDVAGRWTADRSGFWDALLGVLRNALPVAFVTDQVARSKRLSGSRTAAREYLSGVHGYGTILNRLRGSRVHRVGGYLEPRWAPGSTRGSGLPLAQLAALDARGDAAAREEARKRMGELFAAFLHLAKELHQGRTGEADEPNSAAELAKLIWQEDLGLTASDGWYPGHELRKEDGPYAFLPSMLGSKADHLWAALDTACAIDGATQRLRHYDGYHLLATLNDLRVQDKDTAPDVPGAVIEQVMELFVASLEGLLAQLSWCVELAGFPELAAPFRPADVALRPAEGFVAPSPDDVAQVLRVVPGEGQWEVFVLGIPGEGSVGRPSYHEEGRVHRFGKR